MLDAIHWLDAIPTHAAYAVLAVALLALRTYAIRWELARCSAADVPLRRLRTDLGVLFVFWLCLQSGVILPSALPAEPTVQQMADYLVQVHQRRFWGVLAVALIFATVFRYLRAIDTSRDEGTVRTGTTGGAPDPSRA